MLGKFKVWLDGCAVTGNDRLLLQAICEHASADFGECVASQKRLAWDMGGVRRQTVTETLARLVRGGYVEKSGSTDNETLRLNPCLSRPQDRSPEPPDPCPESGHHPIGANPHGCEGKGGVRKTDVSGKRTQIRKSLKAKAKSSNDEEVATNPSTTRAKANTKKTLQREFDSEFWPSYPRRVKKADAFKAFVAARRKADIETILAGVGRSTAHWTQRGMIDAKGRANEFVPYPGSWLRGESWSDELDLSDEREDMTKLTGSTAAGRKRAQEWAS